MYKLILCLRYLRTRYIALASIVSVTLGVATMIVVNSVMSGFAREMQSRIHGILSDVVFEGRNLEGFPDPQDHMDRIREVAGKYIAGMTPTVAVPGQLAFEVNGHWQTRHVTFIGVDEHSYGKVSDFNRYLLHPENRKQLTFELHDGGYADADSASTSPAVSEALRKAGWPRRREMAQQKAAAPPDTHFADKPRRAAQQAAGRNDRPRRLEVPPRAACRRNAPLRRQPPHNKTPSRPSRRHPRLIRPPRRTQASSWA